MPRHNSEGIVLSRVGKWAGWAAPLLAVCVVVAGTALFRRLKDHGNEPPRLPSADTHGDALPSGALARLGTTHLRHGADVTFVGFGRGGKTLLTAGLDNTIRLWDLDSRREIRRFALSRLAPLEGLERKKLIAADHAVMQPMAGKGDTGGFRVALTPDGKTFAVARGNVIQLWEVETGKALRHFQGLAGGLTGLLFSPDGRTLAGRAANGALFLWAAGTGTIMHHIKPPQRSQDRAGVPGFAEGGWDASDMAFTPDGKVLAAIATDYEQQEIRCSIKFWDLASGKESRRLKAPNDPSVSAVAIAPDGKLLAYGSGDGVRLCEVVTGQEVHQLRAADRGVFALVFSANGNSLAVRYRNRRVRLWDSRTGRELHQLSDAEPATGLIARVLGDNSFLDPETRALAFSPDGKRIALAAGSTVRFWETASGQELPPLGGHWRAPLAIRFSPDGKTVVSWGADRVVCRWEAATGNPLGVFPAPQGTTLAAFSRDGRIVALANVDNTIRLHDTATGKERRRLKRNPGGIAALTFVPGGKVLAWRGSSDNTIRFHDLERGVELRPIRIGPKNSKLQGTIFITNGSSRVPHGTGPGLAFSPDGRLVVVPVYDSLDCSTTLLLFDRATGKRLRTITSPLPITSFAFAPSGRTLATENGGWTITLWEVASGKIQGQLDQCFVGSLPARVHDPVPPVMIVFTIDGDRDDISELAGPVGLTFSPDGQVLVARGADRSVHFWDMVAAKEIDQLQGHQGRIATVAFAPDGKVLASGATDTTILLWDAAALRKKLSKTQRAKLSAAEMETLWGQLAGEDATQARQAILQLATAPQQAVPFLSQHLKPAARVDPRTLSGWIADLDSPKFAVRRKAAAKLLKLGEQALPALREALRKALASRPRLETRKRLEELVDRLTGMPFTTEQLRQIRAVEALERMGTPEAVQLLRTLAGGAPGALPTREAKATLGRL